jgi:type IV fimbrial biogenesis protein FimT
LKDKLLGFTLIEALVVVSVLAVVTALAMPNLRSFVVRNKVASISNEFSSALSQTRALAVSKNTCATLCAATGVSSSSGTATCTTTSSDFQKGWMIFVNPTCTAAQTTPTAATDVAVLRMGESGTNYAIQPSSDALSIVMFDPRGFAVLAAAGSFQINPPTSADDSYRRTVCLDAAGRPTVRKTLSSATCS